MKIIIISIGTRGDMEPFLAIGEILKEKGHKVILAFPEQFRNLAEESNMEFASLGAKYIELLDSDDGKAALGGNGSGLNKMIAYIILERNKIPAIMNTASGGLVKPDKFDAGLIHFVSHIPYDWIFPKIYGVIHHGGSGTTHLALKYGCPTMIIPHILDQFVWNKIIDETGAGPKGIRINKITTKNLEPKILELMNNTSFKKKAEQLTSQMEKEDFKEEIYKSIIEK